MWNPNDNMPENFLDILYDEEELDSEGDEIEDVEGIFLENLSLDETEFVVRGDGSLGHIPAAAAGNEDEIFEDSEDGDEQLELARQRIAREMSPITPRRGSQEPAGPSGVGGVARGAGPRRGSLEPAGPSGVGGVGGVARGAGGRGRGRCRGASVSSGVRQRQNGRVHGAPFVERFTTDEELPEKLKDDFRRLMTVRARRERIERDRRTANRRVVEEGESDESDDAEEEFFDCEEFVWRPMDEWNGVKETFLPQSSGHTIVVENAYDAFRAYWDESLLSHIVTETNKYARLIDSESFQQQWFDTNVDEILLLFAFWMMLGIIKMPTIKSCFSKIPILRTEVFRTIFSENRYWNLNRAFHLADGSRNANDPDNVLYPMGPLITKLNEKFQQNYNLQQDICIDESLTLWKGPLVFKQYIKTKSARFGIKSYELCESATGYLWSFFVYIGKKTHDSSTLPSSVASVMKLMRPLLNLGHVLYMDNWFNSPSLARYLKRKLTDCVGTLRSNRKNVPAVVQRASLSEGEMVARQSGDVMVVALQDKKRLTCISTFHDVSQIQKDARRGRPSQHKLKLIEDYNQGMGGVDRLDSMLEPYLVERKQCVKWTRKLLKRLLNVSIQNARILLESCQNRKIPALQFRLELIQAIMDKHIPNRPRNSAEQLPRRPNNSLSTFPPERLTERHFIRRIPITDEMREAVRHVKNLGRRTCVWCAAHGNKNKRTAYECPNCKMALCLDFCFERFHTLME